MDKLLKPGQQQTLESRHDNSVWKETVLFKHFATWRPFDGSYVVGDSAYTVSKIHYTFILLHRRFLPYATFGT